MDKQENGRVVGCKTIPEKGSVTTSDVTFPVEATQAVTGWEDADGNAVETVTYGAKIYVLYAVVSDGYWLTFNTNGGSYIAPQFFTDTPDEPTTNPTKPGYTFRGWYLEEACTNEADFSTIKTSTTVYAGWNADNAVKYTVLHMLENADDDDYSTDKNIETKTGAAGDLTAAAAKSYSGFTAQTITQQTIAGDGSTIVSVYYKRNVYEVKFFSNSGLFSSSKEYTALRITAKYGANISDKWPTYDGSNSWATSDGGSTYQANIDTMPLGGASFYGPKGGQGSETAYYYVEILPGETAEVTKNKVQYKLHHSDTSPGEGYSVTDEDKYPITGFTYVGFEADRMWGGYAYDGAKFFYTRNDYQLQFISGGQNVKTETVKFKADISGYADFEPANPPAGMGGYVFDGWYDNKLGEGEEYVFTGKTMPAQNITLYAKWVAPVHTVTFWQDTIELGKIENIAHGSTITKEQAPEDEVTVVVDEGDEEEFYGWTLEDGTPFNFNTEIRGDYDLFAKVGSKAGYTLTYSVDDDEMLVVDSNRYAKNTNAVVKNYESANKVFLGWATTEGGDVAYRPGATIEMTANTILYAVFGDKTGTVRLTYHNNFGATDETYSEKDIANNGLVTVKTYAETQLPARTGYSFAGWNTKADGSGDDYAAGASAVIDNVDSNDLYAVWQIKSYNYTVEYYIDGEINNDLTKTDTAEYNATISTYEDRCPSGYKLEKTENLPLTISAVAADNVIKVYYIKDTFKLTIHYVYENGETAAPDHNDTIQVGNPYNVASPDVDGYTADKTTVSGKMPAKDVTETVTYTKRTDLSYTVNYIWTGEETVLDSKTVPGQTYDTTVTEAPIAIEGYTPVSTDEKTLTITTSRNVINFYYYKNVTLTANSDSKVYNGAVQVVDGYTGAPAGVTFEGIAAHGEGQYVDGSPYPVTFTGAPVGKISTDGKYIVKAVQNGTLTITRLVLHYVGESGTRVYDGQKHQLTGFTEQDGKTLPAGDVLTDLTYLAEGTDVGTYVGKFTGSGMVLNNGKDVSSNYTFSTTPGELKITPNTDEITVTITGNTATEVYNGSEQSVTGYTTDVGSKPISVALKSGHKAEAKGTNVGKYYMNLTEDDFTVTSANYSNITVKVEDGWLEITPVTDEVIVTVTGNTTSKVYNGSEQTVTGFTTDVGDKTITVSLKDGSKAEAKGTNADKYMMGLTAEDFTVTSANYTNIKVVVVDGYLEITPVTDEVVVTITGNHDTKVYNGAEQSVTGFTTDVGSKTIDVTLNEAGKDTAKGTDADKYMMGLTAEDFTVTSTNYSNIKVVVVDGYLEITPITDEVTVTITGNTDTRMYNATEQSVTGYTTDVGSKTINVALKSGHAAEAKGTDVGKYMMGLSVADFDVTSQNYNNIRVIVTDGWLEITPITDEVIVTITGRNATVKYNGTEQMVEGYTYEAEDTAKNKLSNTQFNVALAAGSKAEAKGTDVNTYPMNLKVSDFVVTSRNYSNIKVVVVDGWLKIVSNAIHFDPNDVDGKPIAEKYLIVKNSLAPEETFEVVIKQLRGEQMSDGEATLSGKGGREAFTGFEKLTYTAAGTYNYTIGETDHNTRFMHYDSSLYTLTVVVIENADGLKISDVYYTNDAGKVSRSFPITFTNTYERIVPVIPSTPSQLNTDDHYAYVIGYPDGSVHPNGEITRAEVATIFFRLLRDDVRRANFTSYNTYTDVSTDKWYNNPVSTMSRLGIIKGYPDGTFRPNDPITRAEFAAIAARFDEHKAAKLASFTDIYGHWAINEISLAYENGWIKGYNDGTFRPNRNITRAEAMALINRVLNRAPEKPSDLLNDMNKWTDNMDTTKWYYLDVQEATNSHDYTRKTNNYELWKKMLADPDWAKYER